MADRKRRPRGWIYPVVAVIPLLGSGALAAVILIVVAVRRRRGSAATLAACLLLAGLLITGSGCTRTQPAPEEPHRCTIFTISQGDRVFFGGNGDWINFDSNYYWVDPGSDRRYGAIYFGVPENVQQGFNERGLAYDSNGLPKAPVTSHAGRRAASSSHSGCYIQILRECATVEEVITWVREHRWHQAMHYQMHFADATGDAVVISAGPDGRVAFTRKPYGDGFLVSTNFNLANPLNGSYPCWRYDRAKALLKEINDKDELTAELAASDLDAVHVASPSGLTILSLVGDLPQGLVYVYLFHQFDAPIVLNVADEIARAPDPGPLRDLFPPETVRRVDQAYNRLVTRSTRCNAAGLTWPGLVVLSLTILLVAKPRRGLIVWAPVVTALGPAGLLARWIARRGETKRALIEAMGDLPPTVLGLVVAMAAVVYVPALDQGSLLQLGVIYGLPLVISLFLYQAPLLAGAMRRSYPRTVLRRLPAALISSNLALAGLLGVSFTLIKWQLRYCGPCNLTVLQWWAIAVPGALAGGLLLTAYHAWAVRRGFGAWSALVRGEAVSCPPWRRLWLWVALSFGVLLGGIALGIVGSTLIEGLHWA